MATSPNSHSEKGRASTQLRADRSLHAAPSMHENAIPPDPHDEFQVTHRRLSPFTGDRKARPRVAARDF